MARKQSSREKRARRAHKKSGASAADKRAAARVIRAEKAVRQSMDQKTGDTYSDAQSLRAAAEQARADATTREGRLRAGAQMRAASDIMRGITEREKGEGTRYVGPTGKEARELRFLDPRTNWEKVNRDLKGDMSLEEWRAKWGVTGSKKYKDMQKIQADRYEEMFGEKPPDDDETTDDDVITDDDYGDYIGPGDAGGGYPFKGMELGVGFPKESKGYLRSFPSAPEYGGDVKAESLLGYTPEWAGRDSSDWGVLDPRAYGPPQQVMPWMGPLGQAPLRFGKGDKPYQEVAGDYPGSGTRAGQRDWVSRKGGLVPPTATTAWQPTPYSAAEIANWQRFNQGLLAPAIKFGGQTSDQLAQFGLGNSGLLDTNLMKAGKQTA